MRVAVIGSGSSEHQFDGSMCKFDLVPLLRVELVEDMGKQAELFIIDVLGEKLQRISDVLAFGPVLELGVEDVMFGDELGDILVKLAESQDLREQTYLLFGCVQRQQLAELGEHVAVVGAVSHPSSDLLAQLGELNMFSR